MGKESRGMTREELREYVEELESQGEIPYYVYSNLIDCIDTLEQEPVLDKIRTEIETIIGEHNLDDYDFCSGLICARKIIDKYKAESEK